MAAEFGVIMLLFWGSGSGSEVTSRIAAPMLGRMVSAPLLSLLVVPAAWLSMRRRAPPG